MHGTSRGGLRAALFIGIAAATCAAGCRSDERLTQTVHDLDTTVATQRRANDELRAMVAASKNAASTARAEIDRASNRDEAYRAAQEALEKRLRELETEFAGAAGAGESGISVEKIAGGFKFVVEGEILFGTGREELSDDGKAKLQKIADALKGRSERVRVEGHTDNVPIVKPESKAKYPFGNLDLSIQRALRVADALIQAGVEQRRVSCGGKGEHEPRADNGTADGRKRNRRVEILVQAD
jgi:flagellar motor protein MotB